MERGSKNLIYTPKIRNRRNRHRISHLHFSNLYKSRAFSLCRLGGLLRSLPLCLLASLPRPSFRIANWGIRTPANPALFNNLHFSNRPKTRFSHRAVAGRALRNFSVPVPPGSSHMTPPDPSRVLTPKAKLQRTLIYGNGINFSRKLLKTKDRHPA